jgi:hypothetical protein
MDHVVFHDTTHVDWLQEWIKQIFRVRSTQIGHEMNKVNGSRRGACAMATIRHICGSVQADYLRYDYVDWSRHGPCSVAMQLVMAWSM